MRTFFSFRLLLVTTAIAALPLAGLYFYTQHQNNLPKKEAAYDQLEYESRGALAFFKDPETGEGFTGIARQKNKVGTTTAEFPMRAGLFDGLVKEWYPDGKPKSETQFLQGERHGKNIEWTAEGKIYNQRIYDRDRIVAEKKGE